MTTKRGDDEVAADLRGKNALTGMSAGTRHVPCRRTDVDTDEWQETLDERTRGGRARDLTELIIR